MISYLQLQPNKPDILLTECGAPDEPNSSEDENGSQGLLSNGGIKRGSLASLASGSLSKQQQQRQTNGSATNTATNESPIAMIANGTSSSSAELIYNLSDVERFLPKLTGGHDDEWSVETVTRKRKERQDSGGSFSGAHQERKVIRSNSEERTAGAAPPQRDAENMRRVSSHEDFEKNRWRTAVAPLHEQNGGEDNRSFYATDKDEKSSDNMKCAHLFAQNLDDDRLPSANDFFGYRQKYSKNDSSPSRDYIFKRLSPNRDPNAAAAADDFGAPSLGGERDHERARSSERRSRTPAVRVRRGPPRRLGKSSSAAKENASSYPPREWIEEVKLAAARSSESPCSLGAAPAIDLGTLHEQLGQGEPTGFPWDPERFRTIPNTLDVEPIRDENAVGGYDKRDLSNIRNQRRTLPDKCDAKKADILGYSAMEPDERLHKISKKIQLLKRKIGKCEGEFEVTHGYRASQADKMGDEALSKLYADMRRLKSERKAVRQGPGESMSRLILSDNSSVDSLKNKPMAEIMLEIERRLEDKRITHGRPEKLEDCTYIQLAEEKAAVQRALLWLEGARGRPTDKTDRDTARPLYDRYRAVKRLVARYETAKANSNIGELATIMEHETMLFTNSDSPIDSPDGTDKPSQSDSGTSTTDISDKKDSEDPIAKSTSSDDTNVLIDKMANISNENLHCLPLKELNRLLVETKTLKSSLRRSIKSFEAEFELQNSRKLLKDERQSVLPSYAKYKEVKARLRLLNALVSKQKKAYG